MDPFSLVVGTLTLVQLCIKSSTLLRNAIKAIKTTNQEVKHLLTEIEYLIDVLQALERNVKEEKDTFDSLKFVLEQCTQACDDLTKAISKAAGDPKQPTEGMRVWIRLKCHGSDIEAFKKLIDSYKATLTIAIADVNLGTTRVTKGLLEEYIQLSNKATVNLEERIEELSIKLDLLRSENRNPASSGLYLSDEKQTLEQKASLEQCLSICLKLIDHIQSVRSFVHSDDETLSSSGVGRESSMSVPRLMDDTLDVCTQSLSSTAQHIRDIAEEDQTKAEMNEADIIRQLGGARKCLEFMRKSEQERVNIFEKIEAAEDSRTIIVSTIGDLIRGTDINIGARGGNIMGQMSDESLQRVVENFSPPGPSRSESASSAKTFEHRYGHGQRI
ncbi:hypothetical protein SVAN01_10294 [Stagonosporopsis vannaccii]|nr:hypothetical protein SVAN01_10294 [Stagonosporopsis vannaccii]